MSKRNKNREIHNNNTEDMRGVGGSGKPKSFLLNQKRFCFSFFTWFMGSWFKYAEEFLIKEECLDCSHESRISGYRLRRSFKYSVNSSESQIGPDGLRTESHLAENLIKITQDFVPQSKKKISAQREKCDTVTITDYIRLSTAMNSTLPLFRTGVQRALSTSLMHPWQKHLKSPYCSCRGLSLTHHLTPVL